MGTSGISLSTVVDTIPTFVLHPRMNKSGSSKNRSDGERAEKYQSGPFRNVDTYVLKENIDV